MKPRCYNKCSMWFSLYLKKTKSGPEHTAHSSKTFYIWCKLSIPSALMQTNASRHADVWTECWWCLCSLVQRMLCTRPPKKIFTFHHLHLTAEQFFRVVSVYFKWALCQSRQRHFRIIFKYSFFLHDRALTWIVWTPSAFTDSDLWKCSWAYAVISMTNRICFSCSVAWGQIFSLVPYTQRFLHILW